MRLKSEIFISALTRRVFGLGGFAAIEHRGADAAGAIFIRQRHRDGTETLYAPAPQMMVEEDGERRFEKRLEKVERGIIDEALARERRFDSDLWLVELEVDEIGDLIPLVAG